MSPVTLNIIIVHLGMALRTGIALEAVTVFERLARRAVTPSAVCAVQDVTVTVLGAFYTVGERTARSGAGDVGKARTA